MYPWKKNLLVLIHSYRFELIVNRLQRSLAASRRMLQSSRTKHHLADALILHFSWHQNHRAPFLVDLKNPESKISHTVNFYIKVEPGVILGIWHTVPSCRGEDAKGKDRHWYEAALHDGNPVVVYLHGSALHRAASQRLKLVEMLRDGGFHVLSVDYRGYGDSTGKPTEEGLTTDAVCVYEWAKARSGSTPVCLWGHSLGTGVATNAAKVLEEKGRPVDAIILEASFTNMWEASINYPLLKIYRKLPGFLRLLMDALRKDRIVFPNDENVKFLSSPLLIVHGEDDKTVPLEFGIKLYETAYNAYKNKERVKMVIFPPGFQHNFLCKSPTLLIMVRDFLSKQWA
ncbi:protein ABHD12B isoform X2 [Choloepus didactylus]|uniref:protein ABHD12B isoform X2 n=1 Tax=Choloepus didactylus TaxID=27675 RepID=UPI00189E57C4|nr:protein ABHD12B isoform X2 [Choloepus didactylus]